MPYLKFTHNDVAACNSSTINKKRELEITVRRGYPSLVKDSENS